MRFFNPTKAFSLLVMLLVLGGTISAQHVKRGIQNQDIQDATPARIAPTGHNGTLVTAPGPNSWSFRSAGNCDTIAMEDFQSQLIPATWDNWDLDMQTDANSRPQDWFITIDAQTTTPGDTNYVAVASSWFQAPAQANNWLVMDKINICDPGVYIQWQSAPFEGPAWMDGYKVLISTTDSSTASFTDTLAVFAEDGSAGQGQPTAGTQHQNFNGNNGVLTTWTASLSAYNGMDIYIAFVHDSYDDNMILLDNIFVGLLPGGDMEMVAGDYSHEYPLTPIRQVQSMDFSGRLGNTGATAVNNPQLNVNVYENMAPVFNDSASISTLAGLSDTLLTITNTFTPSSVATYDIDFIASSGAADPNPLNDSTFNGFAVTDSVYGRDDGNVGGALSIGQGSNGFIGQQFEMVQSDSLVSIGFFVTAPTMGDTIRGAVMPMGLEPIGPPIAYTDPLIITDTASAYYELPIAGGPLALNPGDYFLGLEETVNGTLTLGTSNTKFTPGKGWVFFNGAWSNSENFSFFVAYVLRGIFSNTGATVGVENQLLNDVFVYPNPATDLVSVIVKTPEHGDLDLEVVDLSGRTVATGVIPANSDRHELDVRNLAKGVYMVKVYGEEGRYVTRITVQ